MDKPSARNVFKINNIIQSLKNLGQKGGMMEQDPDPYPLLHNDATDPELRGIFDGVDGSHQEGRVDADMVEVDMAEVNMETDRATLEQFGVPTYQRVWHESTESASSISDEDDVDMEPFPDAIDSSNDIPPVPGARVPSDIFMDFQPQILDECLNNDKWNKYQKWTFQHVNPYEKLSGAHQNGPYPTPDELIRLEHEQHAITEEGQVALKANHWFSNMRKRQWIPVIMKKTRLPKNDFEHQMVHLINNRDRDSPASLPTVAVNAPDNLRRSTRNKSGGGDSPDSNTKDAAKTLMDLQREAVLLKEPTDKQVIEFASNLPSLSAFPINSSGFPQPTPEERRPIDLGDKKKFVRTKKTNSIELPPPPSGGESLTNWQNNPYSSHNIDEESDLLKMLK
tara:strand:- start:3097 stop:4281 length:1185 start_codon:yes stop_codon:yes gene_type:complete